MHHPKVLLTADVASDVACLSKLKATQVLMDRNTCTHLRKRVRASGGSFSWPFILSELTCATKVGNDGGSKGIAVIGSETSVPTSRPVRRSVNG